MQGLAVALQNDRLVDEISSRFQNNLATIGKTVKRLLDSFPTGFGRNIYDRADCKSCCRRETSHYRGKRHNH